MSLLVKETSGKFFEKKVLTKEGEKAKVLAAAFLSSSAGTTKEDEEEAHKCVMEYEHTVGDGLATRREFINKIINEYSVEKQEETVRKIGISIFTTDTNVKCRQIKSEAPRATCYSKGAEESMQRFLHTLYEAYGNKPFTQRV
jgi:hypothetical protein